MKAGEISHFSRVIGYIVSPVLLLPISVAANECSPTALEASGYFFSSFELVERSAEGHPIYRFQINNNFADGRAFTLSWNFVNDECERAHVSTYNATVSLPTGVTDWSVRFTSREHFDIWDDQNETMLLSKDVVAMPPYTHIQFQGSLNQGASRFSSRYVHLVENVDPPVIAETLPTPEACNAGTASGYFFDSYERAEYQDGFLRVHLRLKPPYNDGRPFTTRLFSADENCASFAPTSPLVFNNTAFPAYMRYYSLRFTSPTHWELWDDETEQKIECAGCSGDIPEGSAFIFLDGFIDGSSSILQTTPFPPPETSEPEVPDPVIIIPGILGSEQKNGVWMIDPILHTYDDLIATLDVNGYTPDLDLFPFPYNWRKSNVETAVLLKEKINEVKGICSCDKVDIVAHSMGGLVARQYIQADAYEDDVDQLIFLGTPHLGAPKAYSIWEAGEYPIELLSLSDRMTRLILEREATKQKYPDLFAYIRTEPINSIRELLPIYDYIFDEDTLRQYPDNYPRNLFLEQIKDNTETLLTSGVRIYNYVGETGSNETIVGIEATEPEAFLPKWQHGYPDGFLDIIGDYGLIRGTGDGTVPTPSAVFIQSNIQVTSLSHNALPDRTKADVYRTLTGEETSEIVDRINLPDAKIIFFKIFSPADLLVVAPDGSKIGRDFDGQEINQIPDAFYTGFSTADEFITILNPLDGEYKVYTQGTDTGSYTVETSYVSEEQVVDTSFTGNTVPGLVTELGLSLDNENPGTMDIASADVEPPVVTIAQPESNDNLHSEMLPVDVSAEDESSGVFALETFFDDSLIPNVGSVDLFFQSLGTHTLLASSTDNVGNSTSTSREFRVIATQESTLADLDRAYELGWMNKLTYTVLKPLMTGMFKAASNSPKFVAQKLYQSIIRQLDRRKGKGLNERGHLLLKADIEWLMAN